MTVSTVSCLFVLYAVINSIKKRSEDPCDLGVYDVIKCFNSLWNHECNNGLWDAGCQDDKLHILEKGNEYAYVAVKTPEANTKRVTISNIIMQGTVNSGIFCTCTMDKFAKMVYKDKSLIYRYKGETEVPPLEMIDDILTKYSITSLTMNATINTFMEYKKFNYHKKNVVSCMLKKSRKFP